MCISDIYIITNKEKNKLLENPLIFHQSNKPWFPKSKKKRLTY